MKKTLLTVATTFALLLIGTTSVNAQNTNDNGLIGKARGAAADCLNDYSGQSYDIIGGVETTGICFVSGELHKVTFWAKPKCNTGICPQYVIAVATVYFDCEDNVTVVECNSSSF